MSILGHRGRTASTIVAVLTATMALGACDRVKNSLLEAVDPDIIDPSQVQSVGGAIAVRNGALSRLRVATADCTGSCGSGNESSWIFGGLLADEWASSSSFVQNDETDQRKIKLDNSTVTGGLRALYRVRTSANQAIALLKQYRPDPSADIAEMYFARGFAELQLASDFCNGIPLSDGAGATPTLGTQLTVLEVFHVASASFDTAMQMSSGTTAADVAINNAARIGKARAMIAISLDSLAEAANLVHNIPTTFRYDVTASLTGGQNNLWGQNVSQTRSAVSDSVQGTARNILVKNAIPFVSARDPRVPAHYRLAKNGIDTVKAQDGNGFVISADSLWGQTSAVALTHGIDARLIEAEAALHANDPAGMMTILNTLRATKIQLTAPSPTASGNHPGWTTPVMPALADPGTQRGREDLLFREAAFWQFGRGIRLGNLRRLIREYGRAADGSDTFPTGDTHPKGGSFGTDVNLPITTAESNGNPNFHGCIDRKA
jgi:hypothetical protein